jgi:hypothetical protein
MQAWRQFFKIGGGRGQTGAMVHRLVMLVVVFLALPLVIARADGTSQLGETVLVSRGYTEDSASLADYTIGDHISNYASASWYVGGAGGGDILPRIAFASRATNLIFRGAFDIDFDLDCYPVAGSEDVCYYDIFIKDPVTGQIVRGTPNSPDFPSPFPYLEGDAMYPVVSRDGKYLVFQSATDGWHNDQIEDTYWEGERRTDIFLLDIRDLSSLAQPLRISITHDGDNPDADSGYVRCTVDYQNPHTPPACARHPNSATLPNLAYGHPVADIYVYDPLSGPSPDYIIEPDIDSPLGKVYVAFESIATDIDSPFPPGNDNGHIKDIFLRNGKSQGDTFPSLLLTRGCRQEGSFQFYDQPTNHDSFHPVFAPGSDPAGRFLIFVSRATNLDCSVPPSAYLVDDPGKPLYQRNANVFLLDRDYNENGFYDEFDEPNGVNITLISRNPATGLPGLGASEYPAVAKIVKHVEEEGGLRTEKTTFKIVYQSSAPDLIANDANGFTDIFLTEFEKTTVFDSTSGAIVDRNTQFVNTLVSLPSTPLEGGTPDPPNLSSYNPSITEDGYVVTFTSYATNLIDGDNNEDCDYTTGDGIEGTPTANCPDVFGRNLLAEQTWRVSITTRGLQAGGNSNYSALSGGGQFVYFASAADMEADGAYTRDLQMYMRDQGNPPGNPNVQPTSWHFGYLPPGTVKDKTFIIRFLADLRFNSVGLYTTDNPPVFIASDPNYTLTNQCEPAKWYPEGNLSHCTFQVVFTAPQDEGVVVQRNIILNIYDPVSGGDRTLTFALTGGTALYKPEILNDPEPQSGHAGQIVNYEVHVRNGGNLMDTFTVDFDDHQFPMSISPTELAKLENLRPGDDRWITVQVQVPGGSQTGDFDHGVVIVSSLTNSTKTDEVTLTTTCENFYNPEILNTPGPQTAPAGQTVVYNLQVRNGGNVPDTFQVLFDQAPNFTASITSQELQKLANMAAGATETVTIRVTVQSGTLTGTVGVNKVRIRSQGDSTKDVERTLTTTCGTHRVFLPLVKR